MPRTPRRSQRFPLLVRIALVLVQCLLVVALLACGTAYAAYRYYGRDLPDPTRLSSVPPAESTRIFARDGTLLYELNDPNMGRRTVVPFAHIPLQLRQATIAVEDASFYQNPGVDLWGVLRAIYQNYREQAIVSGGSTITQQLVRNVLLSAEERKSQTFERKLREIILAYRVSQEFSKDQILSLYLNETYYGNQAYGVEAAAQSYFGKSVADLTLAEATMLAGLPQSPSLLNPLVNPAAARARQETTLGLMVRHGYLSPGEAEAVRATPLSYRQQEAYVRSPHFAFYVRQLIEERYGPETLRAGLIVTTTLDPGLQAEAERIALARIDELRPRNAHNAAATVLAPTGEILAMVGSVDYYQQAIAGQVNVALAPRQPGSSLKPVVYAAALRQGWTPATVIWDEPSRFELPGGVVYEPANYDGQFHGPMRLRMALANSLNIPAVKALEFVGVERFVEQAHSMGITTLNDRERFGLPLALGAGEVRLLDLASVYNTLRNGGHRTAPLAILEVRTTRGQLLFHQQFVDEASGQPIQGPQTLGPHGEQIAYQITDMLSDAAARRFMFGADNVMELPDERSVAAKTGTSDEFRDSWAIGYTPDVTIGVWVGNTDNAPMEEIAGANGAGLIWRDLMEFYHQGKPARPLDRPAGLVDVAICADTGGLAGPACGQPIDERFVAGSEPTSPNVTQQTVLVSGDGTCLATAATPPEQARQASFPVYPPEFRDWALRNGIAQPPTEPCPPPQVVAPPAVVALATPAAESVVGSTVAIAGSASAAYVLEAGAGRDPASWQLVAEGGAAEGLLGVWQAAGLPGGEYTLRLRLADSGAVATSVVRLDSSPPTVTFAAPGGGLRAGEQVLLQAAASDDGGAPTVEFYVDGVLLATVGTPFAAEWTPTPGVHTLGITAVDAAGNRSANITQTVVAGE